MASAFLIGFFLVTRPALAQVEAYVSDETHHLPDSLVERYQGDRFAIIIDRKVSDARDRSLIERAEQLFPNEAAIERAVDTFLIGHSGRAWVAAFQDAESRPGQRWWWREWDDTLLPFAITGAAVAHYVERVRQLSAGPNPFAAYEPTALHRASFQYVATVQPVSESSNIEVVLRIKWSLFCGARCALGFEHSRRVVFDENGEVIEIEGDGPPAFEVS
jgi:hypothetical protein